MSRPTPATVALVAGLVSLGAASVANACSKLPVSIQRWNESTVMFIGRATADTAQTGPGDVSYKVMGGHFGPAGDRIIHGQSIDVETLSSVDRKLLPTGVKRVILVPWDYGADCSPTPESRIVFGDANGVTEINDQRTLPDGRTITLRGERVSKQVQTCPEMF